MPHRPHVPPHAATQLPNAASLPLKPVLAVTSTRSARNYPAGPQGAAEPASLLCVTDHPADFDSSALTDPVDAAALAANERRLRTSAIPTDTGGYLGLLPATMLIPIGAVVLSAVVVALALGNASVTVPVLVALVAAVILLGVMNRRYNAERRYRLHTFATANGMSYQPTQHDPKLPGMIFDFGTNPLATDIIRGTSPRRVEFGNFRHTINAGKSQVIRRWGYIAIKLDAPLPHIVLDAKQNDLLFSSNLPYIFRKDQQLRLGGEFDQHFTLYCPPQYEVDALYLFSPDIMARFIDDVAVLDVEIIDDWLFCYSKRPFTTLDPMTWTWLFSVTGALLDKLDQWSRWRDDRLAGSTNPPTADPAIGGANSTPFHAPQGSLRPPPGVAPEGRRLRLGISWAAIALGAVWIIGTIVQMVLASQ